MNGWGRERKGEGGYQGDLIGRDGVDVSVGER